MRQRLRVHSCQSAGILHRNAPSAHSETGPHEPSAADWQEDPSRLQRLVSGGRTARAGIMLKNTDDDNYQEGDGI